MPDNKNLIIAFLGLIGIIITASFTYLAGQNNALIPIRATQTAEAKLTSIAPASTLAPNSISGAPIPLNPNNLVQRFDFENGLPPNVSLGVCDNTPRWYDVCDEAPNRFKLVSGDFSGEKSLELQVEVLPDQEKVYSFRLPVKPPEFTDAVTANVYVSQANRFTKITLAARIKDKNIWIFSDMKPDKEGWFHILVDMQGYKNNASISNGEIAIDEIHIDMFVIKGGQAYGDEKVLIDDIGLYYPLSGSQMTGP